MGNIDGGICEKKEEMKFSGKTHKLIFINQYDKWDK
jgi:hypothetical protein